MNSDLNSNFVPKTISNFLTDLSLIDDISNKVKKLNDYVEELEDEVRKIEAFQRQLPFCMLLLNDAIKRLKVEKMQCVGMGVQPVMEEFLPLKGNSDEDGRVKKSSDYSDKKNWMSSAQLWTTDVQYDNSDIKLQDSVLNLESREKEKDGPKTETKFQLCNYRNREGAFVPFKRDLELNMKVNDEILPLYSLSLSTAGDEMGSIDSNLKGNESRSSFGSSLMKSRSHLQQPQRKQRRCWSPELHRRFVNVLHKLGGAQAATPKQIREHMQVDDLTNDEIKSHLQKYRLRVRKIPSCSTSPSNCLWLLPQAQSGNVSKSNIAQSGSPEGPLHLGGSGKGVSINGVRSMEDDEDETETHSWKGRVHRAR